MNREEIMDSIPEIQDLALEEAIFEAVKNALDDIEARVVEIKEKLDIKDINQIGQIEDAHGCAHDLAKDLF